MLSKTHDMKWKAIVLACTVIAIVACALSLLAGIARGDVLVDDQLAAIADAPAGDDMGVGLVDEAEGPAVEESTALAADVAEAADIGVDVEDTSDEAGRQELGPAENPTAIDGEAVSENESQTDGGPTGEPGDGSGDGAVDGTDDSATEPDAEPGDASGSAPTGPVDGALPVDEPAAIPADAQAADAPGDAIASDASADAPIEPVLEEVPDEEIVYEPWNDYSRVDSEPLGGSEMRLMLRSASEDQAAVAAAESLIRDAILSYATSVSFDQGLCLTKEMVREAYANVTYADPELYYVAPNFSIAYYPETHVVDGSSVHYVKSANLRYIVGQDELAAYSAAVEQGVQHALAWTDDSMSDLEKVQAIHDYLIRTVVFTEDGSYSPPPGFSDTGYRSCEVYTVFGSLVAGHAVCQGYANAFKLLTNRLGIPSAFVPSQSMVHAWNMVQIDGAWYQIDITWDDHVPDSSDPDTGFYDAIDRTFFLKSDATFKAVAPKHKDWSAVYSAPSDAQISTWPEYTGPFDASTPHVSTGWSQSGTCEWQIDNGCLVVRPLAGGGSGILGKTTWYTQPWMYADAAYSSAALLDGVSLQDGASSLFGDGSVLVKCIEGSSVASYAVENGLDVVYLAAGIVPDVYVAPIQGTWQYTGAPIEPEVYAYSRYVALGEGADYSVSYDANVNPGAAQVVISGSGAYSGSSTLSFVIEGSIPPDPGDGGSSDGGGSGDAGDNGGSGGADEGGQGGGSDSGDTPGGSGDDGPATVATPISSATVSLNATRFVFDGKAHKPAVTVILAGATLRNGTDYSIDWPADPVYGSQLITIRGIGSYAGTKTASYGIWFADAPRNAWYSTEGWLDYVVANGLMTGIKDGSGNYLGLFEPDGQITRGQVATVLYRHANPTSKATTDPASYGASKTFSDVPSGAYYTAAIEWCYANGIVTGYSGTGRFGPDDSVTREQLATMLYRFARYLGGDTSHTDKGVRSKADAASISSWAYDAMCWCYGAGILTGHADTGMLDPAGTATRAQAAKMLTVTVRDAL